MGVINLFANTLNEGMSNFLSEYKDGILYPVVYARALDDRPHPHVHMRIGRRLNQPNLDYLVFEMESPIERHHVGWLHTEIIKKNQSSLEKKVLLHYAFLQCNGPRRQRESPQRRPELWDEIREFRRKLEIPLLALRHYHRTAKSMDDHTVDIKDRFVVIAYEAKPFEPRARLESAPRSRN